MMVTLALSLPRGEMTRCEHARASIGIARVCGGGRPCGDCQATDRLHRA